MDEREEYKGFTINELWMWVGRDDNGEEGTVICGYIPLIAADKRRLDILRPFAEREALRTGCKLALKHFKLVNVMEEIDGTAPKRPV